MEAEMDARLARFSVTRDARDLWPAVPVASFRAAQDEVARVATAVLTGASPLVPMQQSHIVDAPALNAAAFAGGMGPLIGYWCEMGWVAADREVADRFATALDHGRRRATRMRQALEHIAARLADRGIDVVVINSAHTRHCYFPDPGTRTSADVDLLMRPSDRAAARAALQDLGYRRATSSARSRQSGWTPPGPAGRVQSLDFAHADDPWSVRLHETLDRGLGTPDPSAEVSWPEVGRTVRVLQHPLLFAHLALRTSRKFSMIMLVQLVELACVARQDMARRPAAWETFAELVARTGTAGALFPALDLTERLVPGTVDPAVLQRAAAAASGRLRRAVRAATPATTLRMHPLPARRG